MTKTEEYLRRIAEAAERIAVHLEGIHYHAAATREIETKCIVRRQAENNKTGRADFEKQFLKQWRTKYASKESD